MPKVNGLSDQAVAQLMELFKREQMRLISPPQNTQRRRHYSTYDDGVGFINESGETVPPYGVMEVVSIDANGIVHITKPTARRESIYLVNRGVEVLDNYNGVGDYGFDKPIPVLAAPPNSGAYSGDASPIINARLGARPGFWHLRDIQDSDVYIDNSSEDTAFKFAPWGGGIIEDYEYDFDGDAEAGYVIYYYFIQQLEPIENSVIIELDAESLYEVDFIGNTVTESSNEIQLNTGSKRSLLKVNDEAISRKYSRIGVRTVEPTYVNQGILNFYRVGLYELELNLYLQFDGNEWNIDTTGGILETKTTSSSAGHTHTYEMIKQNSLKPSKIEVTLSLLSASFTTSLNMGYTGEFQYIGSANYVIKHTAWILVGSFTAGYSDSTLNGQVKIEIKHTARNFGQASFNGGFIKIKRLRTMSEFAE